VCDDTPLHLTPVDRLIEVKDRAKGSSQRPTVGTQPRQLTTGSLRAHYWLTSSSLLPAGIGMECGCVAEAIVIPRCTESEPIVSRSGYLSRSK
jgi:hypothetical protein